MNRGDTMGIIGAEPTETLHKNLQDEIEEKKADYQDELLKIRPMTNKTKRAYLNDIWAILTIAKIEMTERNRWLAEEGRNKVEVLLEDLED